MKIIHFTLGSVNPDSSNGINRVIEAHCKNGNNLKNHELKVVTLRKKQKEKFQLIKRDGFNVLAFNSIFAIIFYFQKNKDIIDVLHFHNVWSAQNVFISIFLRNKIKYFVTPHSGFMPDRVRGSNYYLKKLLHILFQKKYLDLASGLHAISREEMSLISEYTINKDIFCVPNGIDTNQIISNIETKNVNKKIQFGYLGRLSEEKNILGLIRAISMLKKEVLNEIELLIMGPTNNRYSSQCIRLVKKLDLDSHIFFTGKINSEEKWTKLSQLDVYIQPSFSDGPSLTIAEAMSLKLPLIVTRTCNISYWNGNNFLKMVEPLPADICRGITEAVFDFESFQKTGDESYNFACNNLDTRICAKQLIDEYSKALE